MLIDLLTDPLQLLRCLSFFNGDCTVNEGCVRRSRPKMILCGSVLFSKPVNQPCQMAFHNIKWGVNSFCRVAASPRGKKLDALATLSTIMCTFICRYNTGENQTSKFGGCGFSKSPVYIKDLVVMQLYCQSFTHAHP